MMLIRYIFFLLITFFTINGCKTNINKKFKKKFYSSGALKSYGWYVNDSIAIDSLYTFYDNGIISSIDIFDSIGSSIKSISYYKNKNIHDIINFKNDLVNGIYYVFNDDGKLNKKVFYFNGVSVGDALFFNDSSKLYYYNFYDWKNHNLNTITYDSLDKIGFDFRQTIFIDSLRPYNDSLDKEYERSYDLLLIISNPPKCKSVIKIDYLSKKNILMKSDSVINKPYYFKKEKLPDSLFSINILGSQYDSIKNKTIFQKSKMDLEYQKD